MKQQTAEITRKHLEGRTLEHFADGLGIPSSKQQVSMWKTGKQAPSAETLFKVIASPQAASWARAWAGECLSVILTGQEPDGAQQPEPDPVTA